MATPAAKSKSTLGQVQTHPFAPSAPTQAQPPLPKATPAPPDVQWSCETSQIDPKTGQATEQPTGQLTVGQKFLLTCEGPPVQLNAQKLTMELPKELKYALRLLQTKSLGETKAEFVATTYMVGDMKFQNPVLTDGTKRVGLGQFELNTATVIDPAKNPEGKPYGPWTPVQIDWPVVVWVSFGILAVAIGTVIGLAVRRSIERKRLLAQLEKHATALSPYNQFNKDLRKLNRQLTATKTWTSEASGQFFNELNESFRWYLARELIVPAIDSGPSWILRSIRKADPELYKNVKKDLYLALVELQKAMDAKQAASPEDAQQLSELCRVLADRITKARSA